MSQKKKIDFFKKRLKEKVYRIKMKCNGYKFQVSKETFINEFGFHPPCFMTFPSFDDYFRVGDIEKVMSNLYGEESVRENENEIHSHLKKWKLFSKIVQKWMSVMMIMDI